MASKFGSVLAEIEDAIEDQMYEVDTPKWAILVNGSIYWEKYHILDNEDRYSPTYKYVNEQVLKQCHAILTGEEDLSDDPDIDEVNTIELYFIYGNGCTEHIYTLKEEEDEPEPAPKRLTIKVSNKQRLKIKKMVAKHNKKNNVKTFGKIQV